MRYILLQMTAMLVAITYWTIVHAQALYIEWERLLGDTLTNDYGIGAFQTADGGYIVGANSNSWNGGYYDNVLFKLDSNGDTLWSAANRTNGFQENASCFRLMPNGTYMFSGYTDQNPDAGTAYLYSANSDGSYGWMELYGADSITETATCLAAACDSGYVCMARFWYNSQNGWDMKFRYVWLNGWPVLIEHYNSEFADDPTCINSISTNGYIVTGMSQNVGYQDYELLLLKLGYLGGIEQWMLIGGSHDDYGYWVIETTDGGFLATGYTKELDGTTKDVYIVKTDIDCVVEWQKIYGFSYHDEGRYCAQTADGGYVIGATCRAFDTFDFWLLRLDANGDTLWTKVIERAGNQSLQTLHITSDGGYLLCGNSYLSGGDADVYVVKLGSEMDVDDVNRSLPQRTALDQNYPNPFNSQTTIQYSLAKPSIVSIDIFDILGRRIETVSKGIMPAGEHKAIWDASGQASGIYFCRIKAGDKTDSKRMTLLK